jgi:hypothetical protein
MPERICLSCDETIYCGSRGRKPTCRCGGRLVFKSEHPKTVAVLIPSAERGLAHLRATAASGGFSYAPERGAQFIRQAERRLARMRAVLGQDPTQEPARAARG